MKNEDTTIILNGVVEKSRYEKAFPKLQDFEEKECNRMFSLEDKGKYYILNKRKSRHGIGMVKAFIFGCAYGKLQNDKDGLVVYDDESWNCEEDKLLTLWQFAHTKCSIIIVANSLADVLGVSEKEITNQMISDIERYWDIIHCI